MAWNVDGTKLSMVEGDFGISLPINISGVNIGTNDSLTLIFKSGKNGATVLTKQVWGNGQDAPNLTMTSDDSALFTCGNYVYTLDWHKDGEFMCNLISNGIFKVVDKA